MNNLRRAAHWYARHGCLVFACGPRAKTPATSHGCTDATNDALAIDRMWSDPSRNVAIACGPSRLCVVDIDGDEGRESLAALAREHGSLPVTVTAITSRGHHYYFADRDGIARNSASKLGVGVDTRAAGGYVLAPPSIHPSGFVYRWVPGRGPHQIEAAPLPEWIAVALRPVEPTRSAEPIEIDRARVGAYARAALIAECDAVISAGEGTRNHRLNEAAFSVGQLVGAGALDRRLAMGALIQAGQRAGLGAREVLLTVNSGTTAGAAQPRRLSA